MQSDEPPKGEIGERVALRGAHDDRTGVIIAVTQGELWCVVKWDGRRRGRNLYKPSDLVLISDAT